MQRNDNNSRASFLRKASLGIVSVFGLGWAVMNSKSPQDDSSDYNLISGQEADDLIKSMPTAKPVSVRPLPPPNNSNLDWDNIQ
ncbi:MAG: hypothetical protein GXO88_05425 [Chlorobi bacterium]|nr:hypothetical protein [Chlorobiota bacterium]